MGSGCAQSLDARIFDAASLAIQSDGKLLVAMVNPLDTQAIRVLRVATQMKIEVAVSSRQDILETFVRIYPVGFLDQMLAENPDTDEVTVDL